VAPGTRERVLGIADEMSYRPDPHASRLARGRTQTIGIAVPRINTWYYAQVLAGVQSVLEANDYDLLVVTVGDESHRNAFAASAVTQSKRVDGMILADLFFSEDQLGKIVASGLQAVCLGMASQFFDSITIDNVAGGELATRHLLNLGHRRIAMITGVEVSAGNFTASADRRNGYRNAMETAGLKVDLALIADGGDTIEGAEHSMVRLLAETDPPTAVFAHSDEMAMGAMRAVRGHTLRIPQDFSVVGFDDHQLSEVLGLTTIHQDVLAMAAAAAKRVLERLEDPDQPVSSSDSPVQLIKRSSTSGLSRSS